MASKNLIYVTDYVENPDIEQEITERCGLGIAHGELSVSEKERVVGLLVWHQEIDADYIDQFPNLKAVVRYGVGFDQIDVSLLAERQIGFGNTPNYGTDEVADTGVAMVLSGARGLTAYHHVIKTLAEGTWQENTLPHIVRTKDMRLGVVGLGRIGTSLALKCKALGFQVSFYDPLLPSGVDKSLSLLRYRSLDDLLSQCDVVSVHTPLNDQTEGMIDVRFIEKMKDGAILINTARGGLIDDLEEVFNALKLGKLSFAGLDVIPQEPLPRTNALHEPMIELIEKGKLVLNPHTAYYSQQSYKEMRSLAAENLCQHLSQGSKLENQIL
ncbi:C-terminal binding protein [Shimia sp. R9_3]|uniref:C-terminal binding protein n=1 Tax=Shimia sp. R9_3 TaxID=2821113 RepID=UPI001AD9CE5D|nr:C-terminal binding protein [Shimia sp. R9_3]MBO9399405.1 C-terminal binding protein [Shimia sp. R9_3]